VNLFKLSTHLPSWLKSSFTLKPKILSDTRLAATSFGLSLPIALPQFSLPNLSTLFAAPPVWVPWAANPTQGDDASQMVFDNEMTKLNYASASFFSGENLLYPTTAILLFIGISACLFTAPKAVGTVRAYFARRDLKKRMDELEEDLRKTVGISPETKKEAWTYDDTDLFCAVVEGLETKLADTQAKLTSVDTILENGEVRLFQRGLNNLHEDVAGLRSLLNALLAQNPHAYAMRRIANERVHLEIHTGGLSEPKAETPETQPEKSTDQDPPKSESDKPKLSLVHSPVRDAGYTREEYDKWRKF
jgi:hypothetical protein